MIPTQQPANAQRYSAQGPQGALLQGDVCAQAQEWGRGIAGWRVPGGRAGTAPSHWARAWQPACLCGCPIWRRGRAHVWAAPSGRVQQRGRGLAGGSHLCKLLECAVHAVCWCPGHKPGGQLHLTGCDAGTAMVRQAVDSHCCMRDSCFLDQVGEPGMAEGPLMCSLLMVSVAQC